MIKTIESLERLNNSVNGNPRYRVHFTDGTSALTQSDASLGYCIGNPEYRDVPLEVITTKAGRIYDLKPVSAEEEFEYISNPGDFDEIIAVNKVGGGTLGKSYDGRWDVYLIIEGQAYPATMGLTTGLPWTHSQVAEIAWEHISGECDHS